MTTVLTVLFVQSKDCVMHCRLFSQNLAHCIIVMYFGVRCQSTLCLSVPRTCIASLRCKCIFEQINVCMYIMSFEVGRRATDRSVFTVKSGENGSRGAREARAYDDVWGETVDGVQWLGGRGAENIVMFHCLFSCLLCIFYSTLLSQG